MEATAQAHEVPEAPVEAPEQQKMDLDGDDGPPAPASSTHDEVLDAAELRADFPLILSVFHSSLLPYHNLILTDLKEQVPRIENAAEMELGRVTQHNVTTLRGLGAKGPFYGITGIEAPGKPWTMFCDCPGAKGLPLGLAFWGSPHWDGSEEQGAFRFRSSDGFKSGAFESLSWHAPTGVVAMSFLERHMVEFYSPKYNSRHGKYEDNRSERVLIVAQGHFRAYRPMVSGPKLRQISESGNQKTMIALLVPERFMGCIKWVGPRVDVGVSFLHVLEHMDMSERAVEVGGQTYAMSVEIHLAKEEQERGSQNTSMSA